VILVTAAKDVDKIDAAFKLGVVDYLIKPFEYSRLKKSLELYLKRYSLLKSTKIIEQNDIDYITVSKLGHLDEELPKGIHKMTLKRIIRYLEQNKVESFYSEEISEKLRMSKVTVRRYLDYLKDIGRVKLEIEYGMRGRPSYKYVFIR
jgi:response regulator of citrate/malate metabolism